MTIGRLAIAVAFMVTAPAVAQSIQTTSTMPQRTFVASTGTDTADCSRATPCRNFAAAMNAVAGGGEVIVLDSAGYGPVTITKSVSLIAPAGVYAGLTSFSGPAIDVNGAAADVVMLRGLTMNGLGGTYAVHVTAVGDLHVHDCLITGFVNWGIFVDGSVRLYVRDTTIKDGGEGILVARGTGHAAASIDHVRVDHTGYDGVQAGDNADVTVSDSIATANGAFGFRALSSAATVMTIVNCVSSGNGYGFGSEFAGADVRVSNCTAANNTNAGFGQFTGGTFESLGNNLGSDNTPDKAGTITVIPAD